MSSNPNLSEESNALVPVPATGVLVLKTESSFSLVRGVLRESDAEYWLEQAEVARSAADYDLALFHCNKAIALRPNWAEAYAQRARAYNGKEEYAAARADCEKALSIDNRCAMAFFSRGNVYRLLYDRAIEENKTPSSNTPSTVLKRARKAIIDRIKIKSAISDFNQTIKINPFFTQAYANRAAAKEAIGDYLGAIADYNQAIALDSSNPTFFLLRGNAKIYGVYTKVYPGEYAEGFADIDEAIRLAPENAYFFRIKCFHLEALGDVQGALALFAKAVELERQAKQQTS